MKVSQSRSLAKSITWRVIALVTTFISIYAVTGKVHFALQGTIVTNFINFVLYYWHERVWDKISWGRSNDQIN